MKNELRLCRSGGSHYWSKKTGKTAKGPKAKGGRGLCCVFTPEETCPKHSGRP